MRDSFKKTVRRGKKLGYENKHFGIMTSKKINETSSPLGVLEKSNIGLTRKRKC